MSGRDYGAAGNRVEITGWEGTVSYEYDEADRLTEATRGTDTFAYAYDGDGSRLEADDGTSVVRYLWDTNFGLPQLALERTGGGSLIRRYLYGNGRISMSSGGNLFYYHADMLGSVANITDAAGDSQWTYGYEPYGAVKTETQDDPSAPANPIRFTGELQDETGLYHLRARQYEPSAGRHLSRDPVDLPVSEPYVAAYAYAADRPTVLVDPSGETVQFSEAAQALADEVSSNCNEATTPGQRIQCSYRFFINRFVGAKKAAADPTKVRFPKKFSAGLVGNFWAETERRPLDPTYDQEGGGPGRGIAQWDVNDRWQDLLERARAWGVSPRKLQTQLRFVWHELRTTEQVAWRVLLDTTTVKGAAIAVQDTCERANPARQQVRVNHALYIFRRY